jgi:hypothetical protein
VCHGVDRHCGIKQITTVTVVNHSDCGGCPAMAIALVRCLQSFQYVWLICVDSTWDGALVMHQQATKAVACMHSCTCAVVSVHTSTLLGVWL